MGSGCLFVLDNLGVGGSERKTIVVANHLAERGHEIHLAFLNITHDVTDTLHPAIQFFIANRHGKLDMRTVRQLKDYINKQDIQTVWAVNLYPMLYAYLAARSFGSRIRLVGSSNITVFRSKYEHLKMYLYTPIIRRLDGFVFGSERQMEAWTAHYNLKGVAMTVIHNGVDTEWFSDNNYPVPKIDLRKQYGLGPDSVVIGMVAQFRMEKAHADLVMACHNLRSRGYDIQVLFVGDGKERQPVEALVQSQGMNDHVHFMGQLDDVRPALVAMDIFALTSIAVETFSNAALEAMSMSKPAVLSDIGGASEMIQEGYNGYLYPPGDVAELTSKLQALMDRDEIGRIGQNARSRVVERFSATAMANRYESIIWDATQG